MTNIYQNEAEKLLDVAAFLNQNFLVEIDNAGPTTIPRAILAMKLRKRPDLAFAAMMENWSIERIVREIY